MFFFAFDEHDDAGFDADSDRFTNLEERGMGTSPFVADGVLHEPVIRFEERLALALSIGGSTPGAASAVAWRCSEDPVVEDALGVSADV